MSTRPPRVIKRLANSPEEAIARSAPVPAEMPPTHNLKKETVLPGVPEYPFLQEFRLFGHLKTQFFLARRGIFRIRA